MTTSTFGPVDPSRALSPATSCAISTDETSELSPVTSESRRGAFPPLNQEEWTCDS
jgi:hypothetical protein